MDLPIFYYCISIVPKPIVLCYCFSAFVILYECGSQDWISALRTILTTAITYVIAIVRVMPMMTAYSLLSINFNIRPILRLF